MARASYQVHNFSHRPRSKLAKPVSIEDARIKKAIAALEKALKEQSQLSKNVLVTEAYGSLRDVIRMNMNI